MDRPTIFSAMRSRRKTWVILPCILVVVLSLLVSVFAGCVLRVHAAANSSSLITHSIRETGFHNPYDANQSLPRSRHLAMKTAATRSTRPNLVLTQTMQPEITFHGRHAIKYLLSVSNSRSASAVMAGSTITITNMIPAGLTDVTTYTSATDWRIQMGSRTGPTTLTATYVGAYPVTAGASLPPIAVQGIEKHFTKKRFSSPAIVHVAYADLSGQKGVKTIQTPTGNEFSSSSSSTVVHAALNQLFLSGQQISYTLSITNSGAGPVLPGDAITVTDPIPAGLTNLTATAVTPGDWIISPIGTTSPTTLTATYKGSFPVAAGTLLSAITINGLLTNDAAPQLSNTAVVVTPYDSNPDNNGSTNTIDVQIPPDLTITNPNPAGIYQIGHSITYTLTASNLSSVGPVLLGDPITITDTLPAGLTNLTASAVIPGDWTITTPIGTTSPTTLTVTYAGGYPVPASTTLSAITITGTLTTATPNLINTATVSTPNDINPSNNTDGNTIAVVPRPDLSLSKTVQLFIEPKLQKSNQSQHPKPHQKPQSKSNHNAKRFHASIVYGNKSQTGPALPEFQGGQQVVYTLTVSNSSTAGPVIPGSPIVMVDKIPTGLTNLTSNADSDYWQTKLDATTSPTNLTVTYVGPYPVLPGARLPAIMLNGTLTGDTSQLTNTALVDTPDDSGVAGKNTHTGTTSIKVIPAPDLALTKTNLGGKAFYPGQTVHYVLHVHSTNVSGPINSSVPIHVIDVLPNSVNWVNAYGTNWSITLKHNAKNTTVEATYIGHYPLGANATLPAIMVDAKLGRHIGSNLVNTAVVSIPYDSHPGNNRSQDTIIIHTPALPPTGSDPNAIA